MTHPSSGPMPCPRCSVPTWGGVLAAARAVEMPDLTYSYDPTPADGGPLQEGITEGWLVRHSGVGPGRAVRVVAVTDSEGAGFIQQTGEWEDVTIVDDREDRP